MGKGRTEKKGKTWSINIMRVKHTQSRGPRLAEWILMQSDIPAATHDYVTKIWITSDIKVAAKPVTNQYCG